MFWSKKTKQNKSTRLYLEFHNLLLDGFQIRAHRWHWIQLALQNIHPVKHTLHTALETIVSERTKLGAQGVKFQTEFKVMPWILQLVCLADKLENYTQRKWKKNPKQALRLHANVLKKCKEEI